MAGVINEWRTNRRGLTGVTAFEWPATTPGADTSGNQDGGWSIEYAGEEGSRDSKFPSPDVWYQIFAGASATFGGDYEWTQEDWEFLARTLGQYPFARRKIIAEYAFFDSDDIGDNIYSVINNEEKKKLPPHMAAFFKAVKRDDQLMRDSQTRTYVDEYDFALLIVGNLDDVLETNIITESNGFAGFVTNINEQVDSILKGGIEINGGFFYWQEETGDFKSTKSDTELGWLESVGESLNGFFFGTDGLLPDTTQQRELRKELINLLGTDFAELPSPLEIGNRLAQKGKATAAIRKDTVQKIVQDERPLEIYYNNNKIKLEKKLTKDNVKDPVLSTLRTEIGKKSGNIVVTVPQGINSTNLYRWAQTQSDSQLFVPSFTGTSLFTGPSSEVTPQIADFAKKFGFFDSETNMKRRISSWYMASWYGYVYWFINQRLNTQKSRRYNQLETRKLIAKGTATAIAIIIAYTYNQYEKASIWLEANALLNTGDNEIDTDELGKAINNAEEAAGNSIKNALQGGGLEEEPDLSQEELKERQKFVKQCILMYNFEKLRNNYRDNIKAKTGNDPIHANGPYNYRFHALTNKSPDDGSNSLITRLQMPPQTLMKPLLDITPDIQAFLVPKIRLFRIQSSNNGLREIEFVFDKIEDKNRINMLQKVDYDRGNGYGIKSFDFSFEGSNPATARNDITANLSLYFQSFQDLIKERDHGQGKYRIIDLLVFPVNPVNRQGTRTIRAEEYDPSYYRIRADVGWAVPDPSPGLNSVLQNRGFTYDQLKNSLLATNKSFYLNAVDHDMDLKDNGSVEMKINYRAYAENALKTSKYDVLSSVQLRKDRTKFKDAMAVAIQDNNCNEEELKTLKELFQQVEQELIKSTYKSLLKRLTERNKIFFVDVEPNDINSFRKLGYFTRNTPPRLIGVGSGGVVQQSSVVDESTEQEQAQPPNNTDNTTTLKLLKDGAKDYSPENLQIDNRINFFYLGDLIYTAMDSLYEDDGSLRKDIEKTAFLLGSFDAADAFNSQAVKEFNIIDIPVSVEYFYEWFTQNVIKTKRLTYPMMDFIRDLTNDLVIKLLFDNCSRRPLDTKMRFNTATFLAIGKGANNNIDSFIDYSPNVSEPEYPVIDVSKYYGQPGGLPFLTDKQGNANINDFYNYVLVYPVKTSAMYGGVGNFYVDGARGVHHFTIGRNKGLIKKIKFSKTDMNYIREARFFRNGFDGLQQLSAVYKDSIEMYGNTMYYPGMELYIDAVGIGGPEFRSNVNGSLAHILGFGGYHLVTRVNMSITPGKFTTNIEAQWFHSGAPGDRTLGPERNKNKENTEAVNSIEEKPSGSERTEDEFTTKCSPLVSSLETYVEAVKTDPSGEHEFAPSIEQFSQNSNTSTENSTNSFVNTTQYAPSGRDAQTTSNIDEIPDSGDNQ